MDVTPRELLALITQVISTSWVSQKESENGALIPGFSSLFPWKAQTFTELKLPLAPGD